MTNRYKHFFSVLVCLTLTTQIFGKTIFVNSMATGDQNGESWENAYQDLNSAFQNANSGDQIWVAEGTYYPSNTGDRNESFIIPSDVSLLGGFPKTGNPSLTSRSHILYPTILSGDIDKNGTLDNNSYTILLAKDVSEQTLIDGFIFEKANADSIFNITFPFPILYSSGGGAITIQSSNFEKSDPVIKNCLFRNNFVSNRGAALLAQAGVGGTVQYQLENCVFENNKAGQDGGAIFNTQSGSGSFCNPIIKKCNFNSNIAEFNAGAVYNNGSFFGECSATFIDCNFNNNKSINKEGGAVYNMGYFQGKSNSIFRNCHFINNNATPGSGGAIFNDGSGDGTCNYQIINCIFEKNISSVYGGAICNIISDNGQIKPLIVNSIFTKNSSTNGGATYSRGVFGSDLEVNIYNTVFFENSSDIGGAIYQNETGASSFVATNVYNSIFSFNMAGFSPTFHLTGASSISVSNCMFELGHCLDLVDGDGSSEATCVSGNIFTLDPLFQDPANLDFRVKDGSPAIDAGISTGFPENITSDLDGNPRVIGDAIDIGVYEKEKTAADTDGDGIPDKTDNCPLIANANQLDKDGDGTGEACDCDDTTTTGSECQTGCATYYLDSDSDGFGNSLITIIACSAPNNYVDNNLDFNDSDKHSYPNAPEICDGKDNNNDGTIDEGVDDDQDGVCNENDVCPGGDDKKDLNNNNIPDDCESELTLSCPDDISVTALPGAPNASVSWTAPVPVSNCSKGNISLTSSHEINANFPIGSTTVTYTASDECGSSKTCSFTVTVLASESSLSLTNCPENITHTATPGATNAIINWTAPSINSNCAIGNTSLNTNIPPETAFPIGTTTVTYTATDGCNNSATCSFKVTVLKGNSNLTINCPENIVVNTELGATNAVVNWDAPTANSDCSIGDVSVNTSIPSGSTFPIGTTTVVYTATDGCNNTTTCSFKVTVNKISSKVTINCLDDIELNAAPGANSQVVNYELPTATTNCFSASEVSLNLKNGLASGKAFPIGTTVVEYEATDECGETATCSFKVTIIKNNSSLIFTCIDDIEVNSEPGATSKIISFPSPTASTNCVISPSVSFKLLNGLASASAFPIGTTVVEFEGTDACGESATCSFKVTVNKINSNLTLNCANDIQINAAPGANSQTVNFESPIAATNCSSSDDVSLKLLKGLASGSDFPIGTTLVEFEATDECGETATCSFNITVIKNNSSLTFNCINDISVDAAPGATSKVVNFNSPAASTNCVASPNVSLKLLKGLASGSDFPIGTTLVEFEGTDACGETATCSFNVTVVKNNSSLTFDCINDISVNAAPGATSKVVNFNSPAASTNCVASPNVSLKLLKGLASGSDFPIGTTLVEFEGTDACGETATCSFNVTVVKNNSSLTFDCINDIQINAASGATSQIVSYDNPTATTNCTTGSDVSLKLLKGLASGAAFPIGTTLVEFEGTDACGATATCSFQVTVIENNSNISFNCPKNINITVPAGSLGGVATWATPEASTNCTNTDNQNNTSNSCEGKAISGFKYLGNYNNSDYYISNAKSNWLGAEAICEASGGTLVGIENKEENDYIKSIIGFEIVHIGITDQENEGAPVWVNGEAMTFNNFGNFTSNTEHKDFGVFYPWDGSWDWLGNGTWKLFLMEIKCNATPAPSVTTVKQTAGPKSGSTFPVGTTTITYQATDNCNNSTNCSFTITVSEAAVNCQPLTDPGKISGNESICDPYDPQTIFSSSLPSGGTGEIEYVWLKSETGCPTDISQAIENSNNPFYNPPFITKSTYYVRWSRRANCTEWIASNCISKLVEDCGTAEAYCHLSAEQPWQEWISKVELSDLSHPTGKSLGYRDYTNLTANVSRGKSYNLSVEIKFSYNHWDEYIYAWIDFNQDNDFNDPGELVMEKVSISSGNGTPQPAPITANITIPNNSKTGVTRMRIAMKREKSYSPCDAANDGYIHGEVEDYSVRISAPAANRAAPMLSFEAYPTPGESVLEWFSNTTDLEAYFEVERSADKENFEVINDVMVENQQDIEHFYKISDQNPLIGANYYRLKQVYLDGSINYSPIKKLEFGNPEISFQFYPNPVQERLNIDLSNYVGKKGNIQIINLMGQVQQQLSLPTITNETIQLDLNHIQNGMHQLLILIEGHKMKSELFLIEKAY